MRSVMGTVGCTSLALSISVMLTSSYSSSRLGCGASKQSTKIIPEIALGLCVHAVVVDGIVRGWALEYCL
jgi:hypothetical protein